MKVEIENIALPLSSNSKFPCIGVSINNKDLIVMFSDGTSGVVIHADSCDFYHQSEYREDWCIDNFELYKGKVILQND
jgi:hypothetical protein